METMKVSLKGAEKDVTKNTGRDTLADSTDMENGHAPGPRATQEVASRPP